MITGCLKILNASYFQARSGKFYSPDNQPAGPESKIARLAGERFRMYLETSACFKLT